MRLYILLLGVFIGLSACTPMPEATKPKSGPEISTPTPPSATSRRLQTYYAGLQTRLKAQGKMREDYDPPDVQFTAADLAKDFERVALFDEYTEINGHFVAGRSTSSLRRWQQPVRIGMNFGPSVTEEQRARDTAYVRKFSARLARLSGLEIKLTDANRANFSLLFLNRDEQRTYAASLIGQVAYLTPLILNEIKTSPRSIYCVTYAISEKNSTTGYKGVVILIKGEHRGLMRTSCIQEEMTQALGLANDSPKARPSIFNDDEEFSLLTRHDELLLKMLYDPRLKVGMTLKQAHPIVQEIAQELMSSVHS
ncbi:MAG: DUF2927 domain-containing protein [Rhodobacterales bacterium]